MSKEKKLIPKLRFPDFKNNGEWKEKALGNLAKRIILKNKDARIIKVLTNSAVYGIIDQREYFDKDIANKSNLENYYVVEDGDYVYNPRKSSEAPVGPTSKNKTGHTGVMSPLYTIFRFLNNENQFYEYYFISKHWYDSIRKASNTGARFDRMSITDSVFMKIPVLYTQPIEQQKIAACLSSLDELITIHSDKLEILKNHKKGLMQNLFPQEGQKTPNYRFPEFKKDGEWTQDIIDNTSLLVTDYVANGSFKSLRENVNVSNQKEFAYYVRLVDLRAGLGHSEQKFVDESSYNFLKKSSLQGGELLMANIGANVGEVWQMPKINYKATLAPNMLMIKFRKVTTSDFVFYFLQSGQGRKNISLAISGSGHPKINKTDLKQVKLSIPPSESEERKIASCFSIVDELITAQKEKIQQLQQHKNGLMQGLFPKIRY